ncbi:MAG TPA: sigma-54-dependent Fis family transcriptional regulator [Candidatus Binatia bacterium]|nr:sigma-54-dependent Fis family transcriptional regulator [Candidatus Binatia bacterium]
MTLADLDREQELGSGADREHVVKLRAVLNICRRMRSMTDLASLQELITREAKELLQAERVSIFVFDRDRCELWSAISQEGRVMRFDARLGIAGAVAMSGQPINAADAYEHPLFYKEVDAETGYHTRTLLAVPLHSLDGAVIGVGEATNKASGTFTDEDGEILATLAAHLADVFENSPIAAELKTQKTDRETYPAEQIINGFLTQNIIGMSHRIRSTIRLIDQIRPSSVDVLIQGESGTGKELIAKALHYNSPRTTHPFVAVNCAALPDNLIESELFGIEKGVATGVDRRIGRFEAAHGGTLFLDEIGDLSLAAQAKILRVLQERTVDRVGGRTPVAVDVRVIAATNRNLEARMKDNLFREDLYYRLSVVRIQTPALREIPEDISVLANHFLQKHCVAMAIDSKQFTQAAMDRLMRYHWPGNARQLENEVKRLIASVRGRTILEEHIAIQPEPAPENSKPPSQQQSGKSLFEAVEALEKQMIYQAIKDAGGNKQKAAQVLGLSRQGLIKKLKRLGLPST